VTKITPLLTRIPWNHRPLDYAVAPCAARSARNGSRSTRLDERQPSAAARAASAPMSSEDGRGLIRQSCWPGTLIPPVCAISSARRCAKFCLRPVLSRTKAEATGSASSSHRQVSRLSPAVAHPSRAAPAAARCWQRSAASSAVSTFRLARFGLVLSRIEVRNRLPIVSRTT
jgi:hypothetical protein